MLHERKLRRRHPDAAVFASVRAARRNQHEDPALPVLVRCGCSCSSCCSLFAVKNTAPVRLQFFFDTGWEVPLVVLLLVFFAAGRGARRDRLPRARLIASGARSRALKRELRRARREHSASRVPMPPPPPDPGIERGR